MILLGETAIEALRRDGVSPNQIRGATVDEDGTVTMGHQGNILSLDWNELRYVVADALTGIVPLRRGEPL